LENIFRKMKTEFKMGDMVRIIKINGQSNEVLRFENFLGNIGRISSIDGIIPYSYYTLKYISGDKKSNGGIMFNNCSWNENELKLTYINKNWKTYLKK